MKQGKVWGETHDLLKTPLIEIHRIFVNPNSFCSIHKHEFKWNAFYCIGGSINVNVKKDYNLTDVTTLEPGDFITVAPGEEHWFHTSDGSAEVLEIYYTTPLSEDIIRSSVGGVADTPESTG